MSTPVEDRIPPLAALVVAVVAVSTSAVLVRWSEAPNVVKAFYRVLFTLGLLAPAAATRSRESLRSVRGRDFGVAAVSGTLLALHFTAWFESLDWTSVAASVTLVQAQPVFVVAGAWALLDERVSRASAFGIVVALVGMAGMSVSNLSVGAAVGPRPLYGNALALVGAVAAAGYVLAGRSLRQRMALLPYVTVVYGACAVVLLWVILARGLPLSGYPAREWLLFLGMAVGPGVFGHTVVNWALAHVESSVVSVSLLGEPVGSTLLALALLRERPTAATAAGGCLVLAGIYLTARGRGADG